jgi:hypothetical protein
MDFAFWTMLNEGTASNNFYSPLIVGSAFSARFAHNREKQVSRVTKCLVEILYGKPHQKKIFSFAHLKMRVFAL